MQVRSELTIEPFVEGEPGPHVTSAINALIAAGFNPQVGPFATLIQGTSVTVHKAIQQASIAAYASGATAVTCHSSLVPDISSSEVPAELADAISPVLNRLGATLIPPAESGPDDLPLIWEGKVVAMVQPPASGDQVAPLHQAVPRLIQQLETEFGKKLAELGREEKQMAARWLEERGAFQLRNSVDLVADAMSVSRVTVYTYLSAIRTSGEDKQG